MGILDRFRGENGGSIIIAAADVLDLEDKDKARQRRAAEWQTTAFANYERIPEVWFAHNYVANALRRVRLYPAQQLDPRQPPTPLDPAIDTTRYVRAMLELDRLRGEDGTHGELIHGMAMQISIPGEGYIVLDEDPETRVETSGVYSIFELEFKNDEWVLVEDEGGANGQPLGSEAVVLRFWREHPKYRMKADSGMRAAEEACEELLVLSRYARSAARSRMNAGVTIWPSEGLPTAIGPQSPQAGNLATLDPFIASLVSALTQPIQEEGSASAVVPAQVKMKSQYIKEVRHLEFGRPFDETAAQQRQEQLGRIASGLDLPKEVVLGIADLNHWTAWQVDDDTFKAHLEPLIQLICSSLTKAFLRPALGEEDLDTIVWFDAGDLISHPNRSSDADSAHDRLVLSDASYRRYKGYTEADAPTIEEINERVARAAATSAPNVTVEPPSPNEDAESEEPGPPDAATSQRRRVVIVAANNPPRSNIGRELRDIDFTLRTRLQVIADDAATKAINEMSSRLEESGTMGTLAAREFITEEDEDSILEEALLAIAAVYGTWVAQAQRRVREIALRHGDATGFDAVAAELRQADDRAFGLTRMQAGVADAVTQRVFSPAAVPRVGEYDATTVVPAGVVRDSLIVAGGGTPGDVLSAATEQPQGGVATGDTAMEILLNVKLAPSAWEWVYGGGSRTRSFEAHEELDGVQFLDWQDDRLAVRDEDSWLGTSYYYPGDHLYCQCDFIPVIEEATEEEDT